MSTFEVLSVLVSCLALLVSLVVWSGQRRLQQEANDLAKVTAELSRLQHQMLEKQELEPLFSRMWRQLHPSLDRYISGVSEWLADAIESLEASTSQRLSQVPALATPSYEAVDWRYKPEAETQLSEVVRIVNSLSDEVTFYNQYRLIASEEFWLVEGLAEFGYGESRYDAFGGEDKFIGLLRKICSDCGVTEGQPASDLRASSEYKRELERSHQHMRQTIEALSSHLNRFRLIRAELNAKLSVAET